MAKKVVVAQGGSVIFKSAEGKGSTFGFTFSKEKLAVPDHLEAQTEVKAEATPS
jgi:signal transduction histidine kinase